MNNIYEQTFPEEICGLEIEGVDVQMLALDALRLLSYFSRESDFTAMQYRVLLEIESDLPKLIKGVEAQHRKYFETLHSAVREVLKVYHQKAH